MNSILSKIIILTLSLTTVTQSRAQSDIKRTNWWHFGNKASINFGTNPPSVYSNSAMMQLEGSASMSDINGNLLFYTDGMKVWNRNNTQMPNGNGLNGHPSSSHSAMIVPYPGDSSLYFVFSVPTLANFCSYSLIDMRKDTGRGDIDTSNKNHILRKSGLISDKIAATKHRNGRDVWVVVQEDATHDLYAYLITSNGIDTNAIKSGTNKSGAVGHYGTCSFSPNGKHFAIVCRNSQSVQVLDFNNSNGLFSNERVINSGSLTYGTVFSPSSRFLYYSSYDTLLQVDLRAGSGTSAALMNSKTIIRDNDGRIGQMQIAPNNKIYIAHPNIFYNWLGVIEKPNFKGATSGYKRKGIPLDSSNSSRSRYGLPTFVSTFLNRASHTVLGSPCVNGVIDIKSKMDTSVYDSLHVSFGDTSSRYNTSIHRPDTHRYAVAGTYIISTFWYYHQGSNVYIDTVTQELKIGSPPTLQLGNDTVLCGGDSIMATVNSNISFQFYWDDSSSVTKRSIGQTGMYWATAENICGTSRDTISVGHILPRSIYLGNDTILCNGDSMMIGVSDSLSRYRWGKGDTIANIWVKGTQAYTVEQVNLCGTAYDTILVKAHNSPSVNLGPDTTICSTSIVVLDPGKNDEATFKWHTGSPFQKHWITSSGKKFVTITNACGVASDTINILREVPLQLSIGADTTICSYDSLLLKNSTKLPNYQWQNGNRDSSLIAKSVGVYSLSSSNACGTFIDSVQINIYQLIVPAVVRIGDSLKSSKSRSYKWHSLSFVPALDSNQFLKLDTIGTFYVQVIDTNGCIARSANIHIEYLNSDTVTSDTSLNDTTEIHHWNNQLENLRVYPNPTSGKLILELSEGRNIRMNLYSSNGQLIKSFSFTQGGRQTLDLSNLTNGRYVLQWNTNEGKVFSTPLLKVEE